MSRIMRIIAVLVATVLMCASGFGQALSNEWRIDPTEADASRLTRQLQARLETRQQPGSPWIMTLGGWNGEARMEIDIGRSTPSTQAGMTADTASLQERSRSHRMFVREDGSFEWHIVLDEKPSTNRFAFGINSGNLRFLYQGPLSEDDLLAGARRPDSVVGSYAVYHAVGRNDVKTADGRTFSYGTGKLCHVYRPRAWDSGGDTVWCQLVVDTLVDSLVIDIPETFLERARYPIVIDPTFGCTDVGASNISLLADVASANVLDSYTASAGDRIVSYHFSCYTYNSIRTIEMAAYSMSGGEPDERLASPVVITVQNDAPAQWYSSTSVSQPMASGETYCVAVGAVSGSNVRAQYDTDPSARCDDNTAGGQLAADWTTTSSQDRRMSWYVTYETSGEPDDIPTRRRRSRTLGR
ncbi:hypothetical protein KQH82_10800 [bacterium]|nr:hypothetical protein [bacterium]